MQCLLSIGNKPMRANTSSPGVSGHKCGAMSVGPDNPATAYGRSHQGPQLPGLEVEVPLRS
jgi:hypothetical protein